MEDPRRIREHLLRQGAPPVVAVISTHDALDGCWQVLCGTTDDPADGRVVGLDCAYDLDPSIGELADLPLGWWAWRASPDAPWQREPRPDDDAERA